MGGIENVVLNQAQVLVKSGHSVTILTSRLAGNKAIEHHGKIKIVRIPAYNLLEQKFGIPYPLFSPALAKAVKEEVAKCDVVHSHGHVYLPTILAAFYSKLFKKTFILTQHNIFVQYKNPLFRHLQTLADNTLGKFSLSRASRIITVSHESKKYVRSILKKGREITVSYNGVDVARFKPQKNKTILKKKLSIDAKFVCLTVRRITFKNGVDTILQAANDLKKNKDILFLIGGRGPDADKVQKYITANNLQNVRLLGFVSETELAEYYAASDLFILPSKSGEGFPLAVLEAFASGIPVIATRSGGHVEVIEKDKTGYIVEPDDYKGISRKISDLFNNKLLTKKMSVFSRKISVEKFSWDKNVNQLVSIYQSA